MSSHRRSAPGVAGLAPINGRRRAWFQVLSKQRRQVALAGTADLEVRYRRGELIPRQGTIAPETAADDVLVRRHQWTA